MRLPHGEGIMRFAYWQIKIPFKPQYSQGIPEDVPGTALATNSLTQCVSLAVMTA